MEPLASRRVPEHHTPDAAAATPYPAARVLPSGLKATLINIALGHGEGLFLEPLASRRVPEHHTPDAADRIAA